MASSSSTSSHNKNVDPSFLSSMTFASMGGTSDFCDCDECPPSIREAIQRHKRQKLANEPRYYAAVQERQLVARQDGVFSLWKWCLPPGAPPLIEYGSSHRIIYVASMPKETVLKAIGNGVVGSRQEEENRKVARWEEGQAYFVPSNGGRALGWVNDGASKENVELIIIKHVSKNNDDDDNGEEEHGGENWAKIVVDVFHKCKTIKENEKNSGGGSSSIGRLSDENLLSIKNVKDILLAKAP